MIALHGQLGAGKTTLVKGLGEELGVDEAISSPTFTMLNEYHSGRLPLYHLDLYRVGESSDVISLEMLAFELDELICKRPGEICGVTVIEWAELFLDEAGGHTEENPAQGGDASNYLNQYDHVVISFERETKSSVTRGVPTFNKGTKGDDRARSDVDAGAGAGAGGNAGADAGAGDNSAREDIVDEPGRRVLLTATGPNSSLLISNVWQEVTDMLIYS